MSQSTIKTKCVSVDKEFCLEFNLTNKRQMCFYTLQISQFILGKYNNFYWVGMVCKTDVKNRDIRLTFMHSPHQSRSFSDVLMCCLLTQKTNATIFHIRCSSLNMLFLVLLFLVLLLLLLLLLFKKRNRFTES